MQARTRWLRYVLLIAGCILFIYPVFYAVGVGFMTKSQFATTPPAIIPLVPPLDLENYKFLLLINTGTDPYVTRYYVNSVIRTTWYVFWTVLSSFVAGYVFARLHFRGKNVLFLALLITTMVPGVVTLAPTYVMLARFPLLGGNALNA